MCPPQPRPHLPPARFEIPVPIFFTTGTLDTICPEPFVKADYDKTTGSPCKSKDPDAYRDRSNPPSLGHPRRV